MVQRNIKRNTKNQNEILNSFSNGYLKVYNKVINVIMRNYRANKIYEPNFQNLRNLYVTENTKTTDAKYTIQVEHMSKIRKDIKDNLKNKPYVVEKR